MLAVERRGRIVDEVRLGAVTTDGLARMLLVSGETIRRDLMSLQRQGLLLRVHGGAAMPSGRATGDEETFTTRAESSSQVKGRIGAAAAALVTRGQTIIIDVGTTALQVARALPADFAGTVATCSLLAAIALSDRPNVDVLVCGGTLRKGDLALSNTLAERFFADLNADIAFLGSGGLAATAGLTDFHLDEVMVRRTMIRNSKVSYALVDSSKFDRVTRHRVVGFDDLTGIITDAQPSAALRAALSAAGAEIIVAGNH